MSQGFLFFMFCILFSQAVYAETVIHGGEILGLHEKDKGIAQI